MGWYGIGWGGNGNENGNSMESDIRICP